ncbi:MAG: phage integrase SAM-like domain-containing protein, partial [Anditalea sp.]
IFPTHWKNYGEGPPRVEYTITEKGKNIKNEHTRATGSLKVYKTLKRHLQIYQATTKQIIRPDQLDYAFVQSFQSFLINWEEVHKTTSTVRLRREHIKESDIRLTVKKTRLRKKGKETRCRKPGVHLFKQLKNGTLKKSPLPLSFFPLNPC